MRVMRVREKICLGKITFVLSSFSKIYNFCLGKIEKSGTKSSTLQLSDYQRISIFA